jgi:hypothetical protein
VDICGRTTKWRRKNEILALVHSFIIKLMASNPSLSKYLRSDNPGENISLKISFSKRGLTPLLSLQPPIPRSSTVRWRLAL